MLLHNLKIGVPYYNGYGDSIFVIQEGDRYQLFFRAKDGYTRASSNTFSLDDLVRHSPLHRYGIRKIEVS